VPAHRPGLTFAAGARGDDKIVFAASDRIDQQPHQIATICTVAIHKDDDSALRSGGGDPCRASAAIASRTHGNNPRPGRSGYRRRAVAAAAVDNDDLTRQISRDLAQNILYRLRFIDCRDHDRDG
jgi:hypothetical protein